MLKTETTVIATDYDFEEVRELTAFCDCGLPIPNESLELLTDETPYVCQCGKATKLADLDAYADSLIQPIPKEYV